MSTQILLIDGLDPEELFALSREDQDRLIFTEGPVLFQFGSAEILAEFSRSGETMVVQLAEIRGGGEGVLLKLLQLLRRFARGHEFQQIEWIVHAVMCKNPNFKLRKTLEKLGLERTSDPRFGEIYYRVLSLHRPE